jgi:hypothetical protein
MPITATRRILAAPLAALALAACDAPPSAGPAEPSRPVAAAASHGHGPANGPEIQKWVAGLRSATAAFHQFETAVAAGYDAQITPCMQQPGTGGMGYHYGKPALIDGTVEEFAPELLLFEPQKNGKLRLVAVEYIVPFTAWSAPEPPVLHGLTFHANQTFQVWALHVWTFEHNPAGMFTDWNPRISCQFAR